MCAAIAKLQSLQSLVGRFTAAGGRLLVCPLCFNARKPDPNQLAANAALGGTVQLWEWIGAEPVVNFSY